MKLRFTKMQGAGNDFVVLDATRGTLPLDRALLQRLGDRRFGVGADQILVVEPATQADVDFRYRIFNGASGEEVEHCGNGARCLVRYVREHGLIDRDVVRVQTLNNRLELRLQADGRVTVDMNAPVFAHEALPFDASGLASRAVGQFELWPLVLERPQGQPLSLEVAVLSMGNPHAVHRVDDVEQADVATQGPLVESHPRFARRVNAGFVQVVSPREVKLRVYERDAGETLACGTGACAAVVAGIRLGWLGPRVDVHTRGGVLTIEWPFEAQGLGAHVMMTGPAETVFEGEISL
jgi:diaminopimelate epimerase